MRLLLDANVGSTVAAALVDAGHDVVRAATIDPRAEDADVLARAVREDRILIAHDRDFGELIFRRKLQLPVAIVYIRYQPEEVAEVARRLLSVLVFEDLNGHMTVLDERRIRRTPFPIGINDNG